MLSAQDNEAGMRGCSQATFATPEIKYKAQTISWIPKSGREKQVDIFVTSVYF